MKDSVCSPSTDGYETTFDPLDSIPYYSSGYYDRTIGDIFFDGCGSGLGKGTGWAVDNGGNYELSWFELLVRNLDAKLEIVTP